MYVVVPVRIGDGGISGSTRVNSGQFGSSPFKLGYFRPDSKWPELTRPRHFGSSRFKSWVISGHFESDPKCPESTILLCVYDHHDCPAYIIHNDCPLCMIHHRCPVYIIHHDCPAYVIHHDCPEYMTHHNCPGHTLNYDRPLCMNDPSWLCSMYGPSWLPCICDPSW